MKVKILKNFYLANVQKWYFRDQVIDTETDPGWKHISDLKELYEVVSEETQEEKPKRKRKKGSRK